ncbi:hypothetical protein FV219_05480 [Methylobacterium sp. WL122]|nr:hypothetical protein FV219_05480 [Methylobacterium sp. WL122]
MLEAMHPIVSRAAIAFCYTMVLADTALADPLSLSIIPAKSEISNESDQFADIDLGGGLIEFLLTGRIGRARHSPSDIRPTAQVMPYSGLLKPGEVVINVTKKKVYRILPNGMMEVYNNRIDVSGLISRGNNISR